MCRDASFVQRYRQAYRPVVVGSSPLLGPWRDAPIVLGSSPIFGPVRPPIPKTGWVGSVAVYVPCFWCKFLRHIGCALRMSLH